MNRALKEKQCGGENEKRKDRGELQPDRADRPHNEAHAREVRKRGDNKQVHSEGYDGKLVEI